MVASKTCFVPVNTLVLTFDICNADRFVFMNHHITYLLLIFYQQLVVGGNPRNFCIWYPLKNQDILKPMATGTSIVGNTSRRIEMRPNSSGQAVLGQALLIARNSGLISCVLSRLADYQQCFTRLVRTSSPLRFYWIGIS